MSHPNEIIKPLDICVWCGKAYTEHTDNANPNYTPRVPCAMLKSGFIKK